MTLFLLVLTLEQAIGNVRVEGNVRISDATVLAHASLTSMDELPEAFQRLWDTGLFEDIVFEREGDVLVIRVEEKPILASFEFTGEDVPERELVEALGLRPNQPFGETDRRRVELLARELLGADSIVTAMTSETGDGRVELVVSIERKDHPTIESLDFVGNSAVSDAELRSVIESRPQGWLTWITGRDQLRVMRLEADAARILELYRSKGYLDASVDVVANAPDVTFVIDEGSRYRLHHVSVSPGFLLSREDVEGWLPAPGGVFDERVIEALIRRLERYYENRGYPGVTVVREQNVIEANRVRVFLRVDEGPFTRVGTISFSGNRRHGDRYLRQHLELIETEPFDQSALQAGVEALERLETLVDVDADLQPRRGDRVHVVYHVLEADPFEYLVGGGINGVQGGTGNGQLIAKSLLGRGEVWRVDVDFGNRFRNVAFGYRDPSTLGRRLFFSIDAARLSLTYPDATSEDATDVAFRVGGPQGNRWQFLAGVRVTEFTLGSDVEGFIPFLSPFLGRRFVTTRASAAIAYEGRDRAIFPTAGAAFQAGAELVTGDVEAMRVRSTMTQLVPLTDRHILGFSGRLDAVWPFGSTDREGLPRFERLFLGSENDLRGFAIRGVGPRTADVVVGGDRLVYASAEYHFVAHPRLRWVGFLDAGNVFARDFEGIPLSSVRYDAGVEIQFLAPVWNIPLRLGYGFNLDRVLDEDRGRFFVAFGVRF